MIRYRNIKSVKPIPRSMLAAAMLGASAFVLGACAGGGGGRRQ
jgi:hypothetical protein